MKQLGNRRPLAEGRKGKPEAAARGRRADRLREEARCNISRLLIVTGS